MDSVVATLAAALGPEGFAAERAAGAALDDQGAIALALASPLSRLVG
jgi:hypothetical protein